MHEGIVGSDKSTDFLLNLKRKHSKYKKALLLVLKTIFQKPDFELNRSRLKVFLYYFAFFFDSFQLSSLILIDLGISGWQRFRTVFMILSFTRIDFLCAKINIANELTILLFIICLMAPLLLAFLLLCMHFKKRYLELASVLRLIIGTLTFFHITIAVNLSISLKYSIQGGSAIEYPGAIKFSFGPLGITLSILALFSLYSTCLCNYKFDYDCRHSAATKTINSKVSSKIDSYTIIASFTTILLYVFFSNISFLIFRVMLIFIHSLVLALLYQRLPYYCFKINFFKALPHIFAVICSFATLISYFIENATFCILSLICLLPLSCILYYHLLRYREASVKLINLANCTYSWQFELFIRAKLIDFNNANKQVVLNAFDKYFRLKNRNLTQIQLIWFAEYCLYACNEPMAALIKLNLFPKLKSNLEIEFHQYCLHTEIKASPFYNKNEYHAIKMLISVQKIKEQDSKVCILFLKFMNIIKNSLKSHVKVEQSLRLLTKNFTKMKQIYKNDSNKYSESLIILEYYRSFVDLFCHSSGLSTMLDLKKETLLNEIAKKDSRYLLDNDMSCLLLVSAEDEDFGNIQYISDQLLGLLEINQLFYVGKHIKILFPENYSFFNNLQLYDFKFKALDNMTYIEEFLLVKNGQGFAIEMLVSVKLISYCKIFFMISFRSVRISRNLALITESGQIFEYSQGLASLLQFDADIRGCFIQDIARINLKHLKVSKERTKMQFVDASAEYTEKEVKGITFNIIYFYPRNEDHTLLEPDLLVSQTSKKVFCHTQFEDSGYGILNSEPLTTVKNVGFECKFNMKVIKNTKNNFRMKKIHQTSSKIAKLISLFRLILLISVMYN